MDNNHSNQKNESMEALMAKLVSYLFLALLILSLPFVGGYLYWKHVHDQYPSSYQSTFIQNCEAQGKDSTLCSCTYTILVDHYTYPQAKSMDAGQDNTAAYAWYDMIKSQCSGL
jgi:hypothetical protein